MVFSLFDIFSKNDFIPSPFAGAEEQVTADTEKQRYAKSCQAIGDEELHETVDMNSSLNHRTR